MRLDVVTLGEALEEVDERGFDAAVHVGRIEGVRADKRDPDSRRHGTGRCIGPRGLVSVLRILGSPAANHRQHRREAASVGSCQKRLPGAQPVALLLP